MRAILTAVVLVAVVGFAMAQKDKPKAEKLDPKAVVGKWHVKTEGKNKTEGQWYYEFTDDGKYVRSEFDKKTGKLDPKTERKGTYSVEGTTVNMTDTEKNKGAMTEVKVKDGKLTWAGIGFTFVGTPFEEKKDDKKKDDKKKDK
jgi:uncharacterized protein (TIGR03066 family)